MGKAKRPTVGDQVERKRRRCRSDAGRAGRAVGE